MDFHGNAEDYLQSKVNIFRNQTKEDKAILNADEPLFEQIAGDIPSSIYWFSRTKEVENGTFVRDGVIYFKENKKEVKLLDVNDIPLKGTHNVENVLAASLIAYLSGIDIQTIVSSVIEFQAMAHRLEPVKTIDGVTYYNDSKATNPVSTVKACQSFREPLVLILGGKDRNSDLSNVSPALLQDNVRTVISFGETKHRFEEVAKEAGVGEVYVVDTLEEVLYTAQTISENGDIVLFSPACASWGMYNSYVERGNHFKTLVNALKEK